jgi:serine/threonine protein kinase
VRAGAGAASSTPEDRLESAVAQALEWGERGEEISAERVRQAFPDCWTEVMAVLEVGERVQDLPARHLGPWKLLKKIGGGAQATVYLGCAETAGPGFEPGTHAALKIVRSGGAAAKERLQREADLASRLAHPNLVRVLDQPTKGPAAGGPMWAAFEYVQGQTLREVLAELGRLPEPLVRQIALEVARALDALHAAGWIHGDVKPENLILGDAGVLKLLDLGAAYPTGEPHPFAGTLPYAAPEQLRSAAADGRADVYGLGVTIYELFAGCHPFEGLYASQLVRAKLERPPPPLRSLRLDVSPLLAAVVDHSVSREAKDRPPSAEAVGEVFERGEDSTWWRELRASGWEPEAAPPAWMAEGGPSLHGREKELAGLESAFSLVGPGAGRSVLVEGAPGIGKSSLVETFLRRCVRNERAETVLGAFPLGGEGTAYGGN